MRRFVYLKDPKLSIFHIKMKMSNFFVQLLARAIASAVWTIVLQVPLVLGLKLMFSGYQGIWNSLSLFLHFGSIFSILMIPFCVGGLTFTHLKYYKGNMLEYVIQNKLVLTFFFSFGS